MLHQIRTFILVTTLAFIPTLLSAQVDSLFGVAREYAFNGKRAEARAICDSILKISPTYADVILLKGRTFSWDGMRKEARFEFNKVIKQDSTNAEAWEALSDVEFWDDNTRSALQVVERGLQFNPKAKGLMLKRTKYLIDLDSLLAATQQLNEIKQLDTNCMECKQLADKIAQRSAVSHVSFGASTDYFQGLNRLFLYQFVQFGHKTSMNSVILRVNFNQRYNTSGFQPEIDMYPSLKKYGYLYVNYGFSLYTVFPKHRMGLEWYKKLPRSYEMSIGGRYMDFGAGSSVLIFTGSLTKYIGNYALIARPFITPDPATKSASASIILNARKYTIDADNYIGLTLGAGYSPDQRVFLTGASLTNEVKSIYYMQAYRVGLTWYKSVAFKHVFNVDLDYRYQELKVGGSSNFYNTYSAGLSYRYKF